MLVSGKQYTFGVSTIAVKSLVSTSAYACTRITDQERLHVDVVQVALAAVDSSSRCRATPQCSVHVSVSARVSDWAPPPQVVRSVEPPALPGSSHRLPSQWTG